MPIYEYQCQKCGTFEVTQRITEKSLSKCPTCKSKVKKLISNTSFQLKGTGWYVTDYARKGQNGDSEGDKDREVSCGFKSKESKETKTETKTESQERARALRPSGEKSSSTGADLGVRR